MQPTTIEHSTRETRDGVRLAFEEYDLPNGLHVILHQDRALPIAAVNLWYHVGSKNERDGKTGFAHLFEHLMFQGSANVPPNGHFRHVQQAGGTLNASTSFDRTNYFDTLPAHQLELGLWLEADRMMSLDVSQRNLDNQKDVVIEERRTHYDNRPYGTMSEELFSRAFKHQSYRWPIIGSINDVSHATLEDVQAFHAMYYRPANAVLAVTGDIDFAGTRDLIERYFASIPDKDGEMYRPVFHEAPQVTQIRDYVFDTVPLPAIIVGFHIPELSHPAYHPVNLLAAILSYGESSRLHKTLVYESRAAQSVSAYAYALELPGLMVLRSVAQKKRSAEELEQLIWDVLRSIRENGVSEHELQKAKNRIASGFARSLGSMQSRADMLNSFHTLSGNADRINAYMDEVHAVTTEEIRDAASTYLRESNATVLYYLPYPSNGA